MADEALKFTFGLINCADKYLTAEKFGNEIAASASGMKQKQIWSLEQKPDGSCVYFKSWLNCYLGTDKYGKVRCCDEEPGLENSFHVEATSDGRWAIKSAPYQRYFGGNDQQQDCFEKEIKDNRLWIVHLAMHPQVNLYSLSRKRYASVANDQLQVTKMTPWGVSTLITLVYKDRGYGLMMSDNRFLSTDGSLKKSFDKAKYTLEFYAGSIAFKEAGGKYLSPQGPQGAIKAWKDKVTKDEKFSLQDSHPQIYLFSKRKNKYVSIKQGVQVQANQNEPSEEGTEMIQMEIDQSSGMWSFKTTKDKYWNIDNTNNVMANKDDRKSKYSSFHIEWRGRTIRLKTEDGKYIGVKSGGNLYKTSIEEEIEDFVLRLLNRPVIVFRCSNSFIGIQGEKLNGNRANYDIFSMEEKDGAYALKGNNGKYWTVTDDNSIAISSSTPEYFIIELVEHSKLIIRPENSDGYLITDPVTGALTAKGKRDDPKALWEY